MAAPIAIATLAETIGFGAAHSLATAPLHAALSGLFAGPARQSTYAGNFDWPNVLPTIEDIFAARLRGDVSFDDMVRLAMMHGVSFDNQSVDPGLTARDAAWRSAYLSRRPRPDLKTLLVLASRGFFYDTDQSGAKAKRFADLWKYTLGQTGEWEEFVESLNYTLTDIEIIQLANRGYFADAERAYRLQAGGVVSGRERDAVTYLGKVIPPPTELAVMARRFAFAEPDVIKALGLDSEYPEAFAKWARTQGFGPVQRYENGQPVDDPFDFARATWRIHWNTIAPTLAYQFFQRLRVGRDGWGQDAAAKQLTFPDTDPDAGKLTLSLALRDAGYTEPFRPLLAAISYRPLGFRQIGQIQYYFHNSPLLPGGDEEFVTQRLQDQGFQRDSANLYAKTLIKTNAQRRAATQLGLTRSLIEQSWVMGIIDDPAANQLLTQIGLSSDDATAAIATWELSRQHDFAKKVIAGIRKNFLLGDLSAIDAVGELANAGITDERSQQYVSLWEIEQRQYRLEYTPTKLTKWLAVGLIDEGEFRRRMSVVGWAVEDVDRILEMAKIEISTKAKGTDKMPHGKGGRGGLKTPKDLTKAEIRAMLQRGIVDINGARKALLALPLDTQDVEMLLALWAAEPKLITVS